MAFWDFFSFTNPNVRYVAIGCVLLGIIAAVIGTFMFFRKRALVGDTVAHGLLPGICLAFLITQQKEGFGLIIGALVSGWVALRLLEWLGKHTKLKQDAALGLVLSTFFGFGIYLLTYIQQNRIW